MPTRAALRELLDLRQRRHRESRGLFLVEGDKAVAEVLAAAPEGVQLLATVAWQPAHPLPPAVAVERVEASVLERLSHFPSPPAVIAVVPLRRRAFDSACLARGLTLALDEVQDPGNVGTLLRTADWYGIDRVLLSLGSADLFHQKVINSSMGSFHRVPVFAVELGLALGASTVPVYGCDLSGEDLHASGPWPADAVIVVGNEGHGLSPAVAQAVTHRLRIPRYGGGDSLNAALAGAIVCDHFRRRSESRGSAGARP